MPTDDMIDRIIALALDEDGEDATSNALFDDDDTLEGVMRAKSAGVIAGLTVAERVFRMLDPRVVFKARLVDGMPVKAGDVIARVHGPAKAILKGERVALNFLQRLSGIATVTAAYAHAIAGTKAKLLDTRKTAPGHRVLDKYAVRMGGGINHRMGLDDMILIKDNHVDRVGSITEAVKRVRCNRPDLAIEVEARTLDDVSEALPLNVDRIMLDNFTLEDMRSAVDLAAGEVDLEASGGITLENIRAVAETGVNFISVGDITHSVRALDISMTIEAARGER
ncbi:MAG TPA: carboxylating nicotinate-nucleotide diphosphorylase [Deltaproteobacteria bacterium]|nr:carboxylating nicotinate-nucleotide diphosphorylase [Deltaproteobacteria bacterium]